MKNLLNKELKGFFLREVIVVYKKNGENMPLECKGVILTEEEYENYISKQSKPDAFEKARGVVLTNNKIFYLLQIKEVFKIPL